MKPLSFAVLALLILLLASPAFAVLSTSSLKIFAITDDGKGLSANLTLNTERGTGKIYTSISPLVGTSAQDAERTAVELSRKFSEKVDQYDYKYEITSDASVVDGPSAGAAMAFVTITALTDRPIPAGVGITGTIGSDGSVGPVGGIFEKAKEASRIGIKLFLIPRGEAKQVVRLPDGVQSINMVEYAPKEWGMKIVEVSTIDQVIQFAFSDIASIDINQQIEQTEADFLPTPIPFHPALQPLEKITQDYLVESKALVQSAKDALNKTILSDQSLIDVMLDSMNESESVLERARNLFDQNFLYSSANYSFLAKVNAAIVKDIAENPSILQESSVVFHSKLVGLQTELDALKPAVDSGLVSENIDWQISTQQRLAWSQNSVDKLSSTQTIVIGTDSGPADYTVPLDRLRDFEFAVAWKDVSSDFSHELGQGRKAVQNPALDSFIQQNLIAAENNISQIPEADREDIQRRFESAQKEQTQSWYLAAATDAAAAAYLSQAEILMAGKSLGELKPMLDQKIRALDENLASASADSGKAFVWSRIYLDHARFFEQAMKYYADQNQTTAALDAAKNGYSVAMLAESSFQSSKQIYSYYDSLSPQLFEFQNPTASPTTNPDQSDGGSPPNNWFNYLWIIGAIVLLASWLVIWMLLQRKASPANSGLNELPKNQLQAVDKKIESLDDQFAKGSVSQDEYNSQKNALLSERTEDEQKQSELSRETIELDELKSRIKSLESELKMLRVDYDRGLLTKTDYVETVEDARKKLETSKTQFKTRKKPVVGSTPKTKK